MACEVVALPEVPAGDVPVAEVAGDEDDPLAVRRGRPRRAPSRWHRADQASPDRAADQRGRWVNSDRYLAKLRKLRRATRRTSAGEASGPSTWAMFSSTAARLLGSSPVEDLAQGGGQGEAHRPGQHGVQTLPGVPGQQGGVAAQAGPSAQGGAGRVAGGWYVGRGHRRSSAGRRGRGPRVQYRGGAPLARRRAATAPAPARSVGEDERRRPAVAPDGPRVRGRGTPGAEGKRRCCEPGLSGRGAPPAGTSPRCSRSRGCA